MTRGGGKTIRSGLTSGLMLILAASASLSTADAATSRGGGVILLAPGEDMTVPDLPVPEAAQPPQTQEPKTQPQKMQSAPLQLDRIRIAVAGGDESKLAGLTARQAPFEIVAPSAGPDLVWDPVSHNVTAGSNVVFFGVAATDLSAVIDRTAVIRALSRRPIPRQDIKLAGPDRLFHKGDAIRLQLDGVKDRALLLIDIAGDGATQLLYPIGGDAQVYRAATYELDLTQSDPFGTDVWVAVSAARPIERLELRLKEARSTDAAEFLTLLDQNLPPEARLGLLTLKSAP